jgi:signal transduction histidine kinase
MNAGRWPWARSLRFRLLAATLVALIVALSLAGVFLAGQFRDHVLRQFARGLTAQLDQITARLEFDAAGKPQVDARLLSDPRWARPYSGLYWQLDTLADGSVQRGVLRSRSLWDTTLQAAADALADGAVHEHQLDGPGGARLLLVERTVRRDGDASGQWRLLVAADMRETDEAVARFNGVLAASLIVLLLLLCAASVAQVAVGLAPLRTLRAALADVHAGRAQRIEGLHPVEVQALVGDFNRVLERNAEVVARARAQAGNLAHAIKTPLAAMMQAAAVAEQNPKAANELVPLVQEQTALARRHVDWHLARSRAAAAHGLPGAHTRLAPIVAGLVRVMRRVHAERQLHIACAAIDPSCAFAGEAEDLQELLGNVLDNACQWARGQVRISAALRTAAQETRLLIVVEDDGPGIDAARREAVLARGVRLDESTPGAGLGLAIVLELVGLYGGHLDLATATLGGLRVAIDLPGAVSVAAPSRAGAAPRP